MKLSDQMRANLEKHQLEHDQIHQRMAGILATAETRSDKALLASEQREFDTLKKQKRELARTIDEDRDRLTELLEQEARDDRAAESRAKYGSARAAVGYTTPRGGDVYRPGGDHSFFRDLRNATLGDFEAAQRLQANEQEQRAMGNTGGVGGSGGEFAPPGYLVDEFVELARAGRGLADRCSRQELPAGVSSINIPKVATGSTTAVQSTQNTALSDTDPTTTSLSSGITSIGGKVVVAQQLLDQSPIALDQMILGDLAADYARALGLQVISGSGSSGQLNGVYTYFNASGAVNITYTQTTPAVAGAGGFYAQVNKAIAGIAGARFLPPTAIVMHPRRWSWVAGSFDGNNRPLVSPSGNAFNQVADAGTVAAQGPVGEMAGLPVYVDPNIPTNIGASTNQDPVLVGRFSDLYLWENGPTMRSFDAPYADSAGVLFRALGYSAFIPSRYTSSVAIINGTGLVTPAY
ncbi:MAG TPA: phage major capsid protein [Jatrophihabitans sp.]|nr:phage major capsid protein [Jatrophihabitans sp.]